MSDKNDPSQHSIFQPRKSELFDTKNRSSNMFVRILSFHETDLRYPTISDTSEHSINDHSMSEKMTPGNILVRPQGLRTSQIKVRTLTQRIIPQLCFVRELSFHEKNDTSQKSYNIPIKKVRTL